MPQSGGFELVSHLFLLRLVHTMPLYHTILLHYYAETNRGNDLYESVNLKRFVYENSFSLQSITTSTSFADLGAIFYKVHSHSALNKLSIELGRKLGPSSAN